MLVLARIFALLGALGTAVHSVATANRRIERKLAQLQEATMAKFDALNDAVSGLGTALDEAVTRIDEDFQALKDQLETDSTDQAAVDALTEQVQASVDRLKALDPDPNNPAPTDQP